jgi:hypothetical protein
VDLKFVLVFVLSIGMHLSNCRQRPVLNNISLPPGVKFAPRGEFCPQGWSLPLEVNLAPRGELYPLGDIFPASLKGIFS